MKKKFAKKKIIGLALVAALALVPGHAVLANDAQTQPEFTQTAPLLAPYYLEFSGKVAEINPWYNLDGSESGKLFVLTESSDGMLMNFVVDDKTVLLTENEIKVGANIKGFYLGNAPAILIYPPQMHAEVLAVDLAGPQNVKAALFDENLLSDDNELKLNIGDSAEIRLQSGEAAPEGLVLGNRRLVVFYSIIAPSLPAQTSPTLVIVLDKEEEQPAPLPDDFAVDGMPLVVSNVLLRNAPPVYVHESGTVMIPLRAVAEALGYEVGWQNGTVLLNDQPVLVIGQDTYTFAEDAPLQLPTAAELRDGFTYVPLSFFREVLSLNNAYVLEKQVFIDNDERME